VPGGRPRKPTNLFDLGFPLHSAAGLQYLDSHVRPLTEKLGKMYGRAALYGQKEMEALAEPLMGQWGRVMVPAEQTAAAAKGTLDVQQAGVLGRADVGLLMARQRADAMRRQLGLEGYESLYQPGPSQYPPPRPGLPIGPPIPVNGHPRPIPVPIAGGQGCPPTIIYLQCPACGAAGACQANATAIANAVATAVNNTLVALNVQLSQSQHQELINQVALSVTQNVNVEIPKPLGSDCQHMLHVHLCNAPDKCGDGKNWWFGMCIDDGKPQVCPAP
jgi:hypothetical protein